MDRRERSGAVSSPCGLAAALVAVVLGCALPGRAEPTTCSAGISRETTERLFAILNRPPAEADCKFEGVSTERSRLEARWSRGGLPLPPVSVVPSECASPPAPAAGAFVVQVPPQLGERCPSVIGQIDEFIRQVAEEAPAGQTGSVRDPLFRGARALFIGIAVLALGLLGRGAMRWRSIDAGWMTLGLAGFSAALVVRAALPFSLGNWYSEVLPAAGPPPWMRFGPGFFAFQSLLRDAGVWNAHTLLLSQLVLGAAAVPLLLGVMHTLDVGLEAAAAALVLLVFAPFHARLSATSSEHVLASTLCLGLLLAWLRAARRGDALWFGLAFLLLPAVCATRIDMTLQALAVVPWPLLRDRAERASGGNRRLRWWMIAGLAGVGVLTAIAGYRLIAIPSQHPTPDWAGYRFALHYLVPQFWLMARHDPPWVSLSSVVLAMAGALVMVVRRPLLLARVAGTIAVAFVGLGRSFMHDELLAARYFLFAIPLFLIVSGYGFEAGLGLVPRRARPVAAAAGIAALALWTGLGARSAYAARYAFQDEYSFARQALARLPPDCVVYQVPMRGGDLENDVDCCLDLPRSPLVLEFPSLHLRPLPEHPASLRPDAACMAYYEGVACEIVPPANEQLGHQSSERAAEYFRSRCAEVHRLGRLELLADTRTAQRSTVDFFAAQPPHARLYRWIR